MSSAYHSHGRSLRKCEMYGQTWKRVSQHGDCPKVGFTRESCSHCVPSIVIGSSFKAFGSRRAFHVRNHALLTEVLAKHMPWMSLPFYILRLTLTHMLSYRPTRVEHILPHTISLCCELFLIFARLVFVLLRQTRPHLSTLTTFQSTFPFHSHLHKQHNTLSKPSRHKTTQHTLMPKRRSNPLSALALFLNACANR